MGTKTYQAAERLYISSEGRMIEGGETFMRSPTKRTRRRSIRPPMSPKPSLPAWGSCGEQLSRGSAEFQQG